MKKNKKCKLDLKNELRKAILERTADLKVALPEPQGLSFGYEAMVTKLEFVSKDLVKVTLVSKHFSYSFGLVGGHDELHKEEISLVVSSHVAKKLSVGSIYKIGVEEPKPIGYWGISKE